MYIPRRRNADHVAERISRASGYRRRISRGFSVTVQRTVRAAVKTELAGFRTYLAEGINTTRLECVTIAFDEKRTKANSFPHCLIPSETKFLPAVSGIRGERNWQSAISAYTRRCGLTIQAHSNHFDDTGRKSFSSSSHQQRMDMHPDVVVQHVRQDVRS